MYLAGIDEAGRGPVLGPLVLAIVAVKLDEHDKLRSMGVKDSKLLTKAQREKLAVQIQDQFPSLVISLLPEDIDKAVNGDGDNLNKLEARTSAVLISQLLGQVPLTKVIVDSPVVEGRNYERLIRAKLRELDPGGISDKIEVVCEIKADFNHPVVGAASILAKVARDAAIRVLEEEHGPIGSGYLTDPKTQEFLDRTWKEGHGFFRKSWASFRRLVEGAGQTRLTTFSEEHTREIDAFEVLTGHGFRFQEPSNRYEVVRMRRDKTSVIKYTTGKILVQGPEKQEVEQLLTTLGLSGTVKKPGVRPRKQ